jgi:uncharacterized protein (TIGR02265 family)
MVATARNHSTFQDEFDELKRSIELTPASATVKGMYIDSFLKSLDRARIERPTNSRFLSFKDYPLRELMSLLLECTALAHPSLPPKEGLRMMGRLVYPTLAESTVGKILFSIAGRDWKAALPLASRAYKISLDPGQATLNGLTGTSAVVELRDIYNFADSYQAGVFEGAMECYQIEGTVSARPLARVCDVDLFLEWKQ